MARPSRTPAPVGPWILALDTATTTQSMALLCGDQLAAEWSLESRAGGHSADQLATAQWVLSKANKRFADLDALVIGLGPGSFTGLRVGLAMMKGLSYAYKKPLYGASSLEAIALNAAFYCASDALLCPCIDARKSELYAALYRTEWPASAPHPILQPVLPADVLAPAALVDALRPHVVPTATLQIMGTGVALYRDVLLNAFPNARVIASPAMGMSRAFCLGLLAQADIAAKNTPALATLEPHYIRPSDAEIALDAGKIPTLRDLKITV